MGADSVFSYPTLFGFLFTLARISGVFAFLPLAAFRAASDAAKIVLALAFTLLLWRQWKAPVGVESSIGRMVGGLASEMALGLAIGLSLAIALEAFQFAAQGISTSAGFGYASTVDPTSGADSTVLLTIAQITAGLLFFVAGADRLLVKALAESLRVLPPESFTLQRTWAIAMGHFAGSIFSAGLRLAAPVIALILLADASLAVLGRVQAQLHLMTLTMPVKLAAAMLLMALTMALQPGIFENRMTEWARFVEGLLRSGH
jgi:flagellar biosynthetic protein FliR